MGNAPFSFSVLPQDLAARIGTPGAPLVLDVRRRPRFDESAHLLASARHCTPEDIAALAASAPPREAVVYCVYGHAVSREAAAVLRQAGWNASFLAGGFEGGEPGVDTPEDLARWRAMRPLAVPKRPDLGVDGTAASRWITRAQPQIDRIACPWLVRRFIDPRAEFLYVDAAQVLPEAQRLRAVAYDIPGAPITHAGALCSFDALLAAFGLQVDPALAALACIVRGADTDQLQLAPQAAGLLAVSLGLSQLHAGDDMAMLAAAMPVYDALYAWCRQGVSGPQETHRWAPQAVQA
ncbi:MAG: chromate resistance protein ChrB domain-containing protein [Pseudomonadota bacterium]